MPQGSVAAALGKASSSGPGRVLARTRCDSGGDRGQACRKRRERAPEPAVVCLTRLPQRTIRESTGRARADYRNGRRKRVPADWRLGLLLIVPSERELGAAETLGSLAKQQRRRHPPIRSIPVCRPPRTKRLKYARASHTQQGRGHVSRERRGGARRV